MSYNQANPRTDPRSDAPRLLYISNLDRIVGVMLPHLDAARASGWVVEVACQATTLREDVAAHVDRYHTVSLQRFPLHPKNFGALFHLLRLMDDQPYTVVHCHTPTGGLIGRLATTIANQRLRARGLAPALRVYTAHGFHFHRHGGRVSNFVYRLAETIGGHLWSDAVMTITEEDFDAALRHDVVPEQKLFLTGGVGVSARDDFNPNHTTGQESSALRQEIGATPSAPIVTMVGEMIPRKRHADTLQAWVTIARRFPDARLLLVGDGKLDESLKKQVITLGIADSVRFLGFRRNIRAILAATDVFLFPSGQEGLPCAIQEALSMEVPTVATDVRGNRDLVDETCGYLVPLGDIARLAQSVCELLTLPASARQAMGRAGRRKMLADFDRAECVRQWQDIYGRLLEARATQQDVGARRVGQVATSSSARPLPRK